MAKTLHQEKKIITYSGSLLPCNKILRVEESFGDTFIIDIEGQKHQSVLSIDVLEWELLECEFKRIHPKHLINQKYMVQTVNRNTEYIQLANGDQLPIAQAFLESIEAKKKGLIHRVFQRIRPKNLF